MTASGSVTGKHMAEMLKQSAWHTGHEYYNNDPTSSLYIASDPVLDNGYGAGWHSGDAHGDDAVSIMLLMVLMPGSTHLLNMIRASLSLMLLTMSTACMAMLSWVHTILACPRRTHMAQRMALPLHIVMLPATTVILAVQP